MLFQASLVLSGVSFPQPLETAVSKPQESGSTYSLYLFTSALLLYWYLHLETRESRNLFRNRLRPGSLHEVFCFQTRFDSWSCPSPTPICIGWGSTISLRLTGSSRGLGLGINNSSQNSEWGRGLLNSGSHLLAPRDRGPVWLTISAQLVPYYSE